MEHELLTPNRCFCEGERPCNVCEGGLAVCIHCKKAEAELDGPCVTPEEALTKDPGNLHALRAILEAVAAEGVTHVHGHNTSASLELVTGIKASRTKWNDGRNTSVILTCEERGPSWARA